MRRVVISEVNIPSASAFRLSEFLPELRWSIPSCQPDLLKLASATSPRSLLLATLAKSERMITFDHSREVAVGCLESLPHPLPDVRLAWSPSLQTLAPCPMATSPRVNRTLAGYVGAKVLERKRYSIRVDVVAASNSCIRSGTWIDSFLYGAHIPRLDSDQC